MAIQVKLNKFIQQFTNNREVVEVKGHSVGECLLDLIRQFPALEGKLIGKNSKLLSYIEIFVNQESAYPNELAKPVSDGDVIHITQLIDGG